MRRVRSFAPLFILLVGCGAASSHTATDDSVEFEDERAERQAQSAHPASTDVRDGETQLAQGHAGEAEALFRHAIAADAHDARAHLDLGLALELQHENDGAEAAYRAALVIDPHFAEALNDLGALQRDLGDVDGGIATLRQAIAARPGYPDAELNLALALEDKGDLEGAVAAYRVVTHAAPNAAVAHVNLGLVLLRTGHTDDAARELHTATPLAAGNRALLAAIGSGLRQLREPEAAVRALEGAVAASTDPPASGLRSELALARLAAGDAPHAEADLRALIHDDARYAIAHYALAGILATKRDFAGALAEYREYLRVDPHGDRADEARTRIEHVQEMMRAAPRH